MCNPLHLYLTRKTPLLELYFYSTNTVYNDLFLYRIPGNTLKSVQVEQARCED